LTDPVFVLKDKFKDDFFTLFKDFFDFFRDSLRFFISSSFDGAFKSFLLGEDFLGEKLKVLDSDEKFDVVSECFNDLPFSFGLESLLLDVELVSFSYDL
jgi:hypothetical protein